MRIIRLDDTTSKGVTLIFFGQNHMMNEQKRGIIFALLCFGTWGLFPIFWYPLNQSQMPVEQILARRIVWSALFAVFLLLVFQQGKRVWDTFRQPRLLLIFMLSSLLIAINWLIYLWAITHHRVIDASLGYFINPLLNVFLGFIFFKERLSKMQWCSVGLAALGIVWLSLLVGQVPYIGLLLAASFGFYAVVRKLAPMPPLAGLVVETLILLPFALIYLAWCYGQGTLVLSELTAIQKGVLYTSGIITTLPLLAFAAAAKRISLSLLGILQNVSPTGQLLLGLALGEQLSGERLIGYGLVWCGVVCFLVSAWRNRVS